MTRPTPSPDATVPGAIPAENENGAPTKPGYYWAKLITPSRMPDGEDWASVDWEIVQLWDNHGEGDETFGVSVPGVPVAQWPKNFAWGEPVPDRFTRPVQPEPPGVEELRPDQRLDADGGLWSDYGKTYEAPIPNEERIRREADIVEAARKAERGLIVATIRDIAKRFERGSASQNNHRALADAIESGHAFCAADQITKRTEAAR